MKTLLLPLAVLVLGVVVLLAAPQQTAVPAPPGPMAQAPAPQAEPHLRNIRQLTFGGQNAEAYFSADGTKLIFQSNRDPLKCDQIFIMNTDGTDQHMVSTGKGRTTCSYFYPDGKKILYSSTHLGGADCPPKPDYSRGYVWAIYPSYDIFIANPDGSDLKQLTKTPGYDAEAVISADGKKIVFTSVRNGDLDVYTMDADGSNVKQLTHELGYDGGPAFSPDGTMIVYRAHHPKTAQEIKDYKDLLAQNLIRPTYLEIWTMKSDGSDKRQITDLGAASFAPAFYPDGKRIIFSSNVGSTGGMGNFELYGVDLDGKNLERITFTDGFDGFPMFSPDGKKLVWISGRNAKVPHETNVFIADWVP
jgi:Tol biopolymer transport system component